MSAVRTVRTAKWTMAVDSPAATAASRAFCNNSRTTTPGCRSLNPDTPVGVNPDQDVAGPNLSFGYRVPALFPPRLFARGPGSSTVPAGKAVNTLHASSLCPLGHAGSSTVPAGKAVNTLHASRTSSSVVNLPRLMRTPEAATS